MDKEILDELNNVADGFWHNKKNLNRNRIENISSLKMGGFARYFDEALKGFLEIRRYDIEKGNPSIDKILGIDPAKDYSEACNRFLEVVTTAKTNDLIIDNQLIKELDNYKQKYLDLESNLKDKELAIENLREIKIGLEERIRIHEAMYHDLKRLGKSEESELEENE